jgi:hypothetical protein
MRNRAHGVGDRALIDELYNKAARSGGELVGVVPTSFVFQPGGVARANVFTTWNPLYAIFSSVAGQKVIHGDGTFNGGVCTIPAGEYNLDNTLLTVQSDYDSDSGATVWELATGVTLTGPAAGWSMRLGPFAQLTSQVQTTAPITVTGTQEINLYFDPESQILMPAGSTAPFISATGGFLWILTEGAIGDGSNQVVNVAAGAPYQVTTEGGGFVTANSIGGAGAAAGFFVGWSGQNNIQAVTRIQPGATALAQVVAAQTGAGSGATASLSGTANISGGTITLNTGTGPSAAAIVRVTYTQTYSATPRAVLIAPGNAAAAAAAASVYVSANAAGDFVLTSSAALSASTAYVWTYAVVP